MDPQQLIEMLMSKMSENEGNEFARFDNPGEEFWPRNHFADIQKRFDKANQTRQPVESDNFFDKFARTAPPYQKGMNKPDYTQRMERHYEDLTGSRFPSTDETTNMLLSLVDSIMEGKGHKLPKGEPDYGYAGGGPDRNERRGIRRLQGKPLGPEHYPR